MKRRPNPVITTGILRVRTGDRTWETELPNGMVTLAHVPTWKAASMAMLAAGQKVRLELTTYDFSIARIAGPEAEQVGAADLTRRHRPVGSAA